MGAIAIGAPFPDEVARVRAAANDPTVFADLYRRYVDDIYRYLVVRSGPEEAEDLVAETFLAAFRAARSYRGAGELKAWLVGIARRKASDAHRGRREAEPLEAAVAIADPTRVEDVVQRRDEIAFVAAALRRIPPERAEAVRLRYFGGLDGREVARLMGRSEDAVKMLVHRGLRDLRGLLEEKER